MFYIFSFVNESADLFATNIPVILELTGKKLSKNN